VGCSKVSVYDSNEKKIQKVEAYTCIEELMHEKKVHTVGEL